MHKNYVVSGSAALVLSILIFTTLPASIFAASIVTENFGTGSSSSTVSGWTKAGAGAEVTASGSGDDSASSDGGRFARMFGKDGSICKSFTTTGFSNVKVSYYWRGDSDSSDASDDGIVEFKAGSSCSSSGWTELQNQDLRTHSWTSQAAFGNTGFNNTTFVLRFRTDTNHTNEDLRVDGITVTGDPLDNTPPTVTGLSSDAIAKKTKTWSWSANETSTFRYSIDQSAGGTPSGAYDTTTTASQNTGDGTYYIHVQAKDAAGNESAVVTVSAVLDNTAPILAEVTPVTALGNDPTPNYTFSSSEAATLSYSGGCTAPTTNAVASNNTITYSALADGTYATCKITATDAAGNTGSDLAVSSFTIDTTGPVIALSGSSVMNLGTGDTYTEEGATAVDAHDGDVTAHIVVGGATVNTSVPNTYVVTYNVSDATGNAATTVKRTVNVSDDDGPTILGIPSDIISEATDLAGTIIDYVMPTANDNVDGDVPVVCSPISGSVFSFGITIVACNAADSTPNTTSASFSVTVKDTTAPTIEIIPATQTLEAVGATGAAAAFTVSAHDNIDGDISSSASCDHTSDDVFPIGETTVTCSVSDAAHNSATATAKITVEDTTPPVVTMNGGNVEQYVHETYNDAGATASDIVDGDVAVTVGGSVDLSTPGTYTITYNAVDSHGNAADQVTRTVTIKSDGNGPIAGGLGGGPIGPILISTPPVTGSVLGASTTTVPNASNSSTTTDSKNALCKPLISSFIGSNKNNPDDVKKLQTFLNGELKLTLTINGVYDKVTRDAVKLFQSKYASDILAPWMPFGHNGKTPTGLVYKTTVRMINMLSCVGATLPMPILP